MVEAGIAEVEAARSDARKTVPDPKNRILSKSMLLTENVSTNLTPRRWPPQVQFDLGAESDRQIASELSVANGSQGGPEQARLVRGRAETESTSSTEARRFCAGRGNRARAKREAGLMLANRLQTRTLK